VTFLGRSSQSEQKTKTGSTAETRKAATVGFHKKRPWALAGGVDRAVIFSSGHASCSRVPRLIAALVRGGGKPQHHAGVVRSVPTSLSTSRMPRGLTSSLGNLRILRDRIGPCTPRYAGAAAEATDSRIAGAASKGSVPLWNYRSGFAALRNPASALTGQVDGQALEGLPHVGKYARLLPGLVPPTSVLVPTGLIELARPGEGSRLLRGRV